VLVLSRRKDETIVIGDDVRVTVVDIRGDTVRLGISAPKSVTIYRQEIYEAIQRENIEAAKAKAEGLDALAGAFGAMGPSSGSQGDGGDASGKEEDPAAEQQGPAKSD
jgi:carbon storage regulator